MNVEEHFLAAQTLVTEEVTYSQDEDEMEAQTLEEMDRIEKLLGTPPEECL